jgi:hypothetical protein
MMLTSSCAFQAGCSLLEARRSLLEDTVWAL